MTEIKVGSRVRLIADLRGWMSDVGDRTGSVVAIDGWLIVEWDGIPERHRIPATDIEVMS